MSAPRNTQQRPLKWLKVRPPDGGLCQQAKDKTPWLDPRADAVPDRVGRDLGKVCDPCPVLDECARYADQPALTWVSVVIAGRCYRANGEPYGADEPARQRRSAE
jgi:hypothetical protein